MKAIQYYLDIRIQKILTKLDLLTWNTDFNVYVHIKIQRILIILDVLT